MCLSQFPCPVKETRRQRKSTVPGGPWSPDGERTVAEGIFVHPRLAREPLFVISFRLSELRLAGARLSRRQQPAAGPGPEMGTGASTDGSLFVSVCFPRPLFLLLSSASKCQE